MKKSFILFALITGGIVLIMFSCKRVSVPVPGTSCIQVALSSAAGTTAQTVAVNTSITPITYTLTSDVSAIIDTIGVSVLGTLPPGVTGTFSGGVFTLSGTPTTSTGSPFTYTVTTTGTSCNNNTITGSITVTNPTNCTTIILSSATATTSQTVAINSPITPIVYTLEKGATGESVISMPAGVSAIIVGSTLTISGTPTSLAGSPYTYTVTTTGGAGACTTTATGTITVTPTSTIVLSSAAGTDTQRLSINTPLSTAIKYAISGSATGAVLTGAPSGVTGSYAAGVFTITGTPTVSGVFPYTVTTTGGNTATANGTITVTSPSLAVNCGIGTTTSVQFIWAPVTGATNYSISYTINGGAPTNTGSPTATPFSVTGLNTGDVVVATITPTGTGGLTPVTATCTVP
jgi:hypothetical protein